MLDFVILMPSVNLASKRSEGEDENEILIALASRVIKEQ